MCVSVLSLIDGSIVLWCCELRICVEKMAPKKKSKDVSSSSSAPFDHKRFWDAQAAENYIIMIDRSMQRERRSGAAHHLLQNASERGWREFVETTSDAVISLVR